MSSIGTNLLFLHGHIHDPELVRRLAHTPATPPPGRRSGKRQRMYSLIAALASLYAHLCLGVGDSRRCIE
jgi:hypothetical protein